MAGTSERLNDFTKRGQEAVSSAFDAWTDAIGSFAPFRPTAADAQSLVDTSFGAAEKVLASQRDFAKSVVEAGAKVVETVGEQADRVTSKARAAATHDNGQHEHHG
ncbi:hypothetical protein ACL02T_02420 [Pseudonocardia sp. RS010]|uniref:hypothetical protein n=1 Tax=Pseudonocardia sp. RS010 TaxID=3385979 RepID=UPI00399F3217